MVAKRADLRKGKWTVRCVAPPLNGASFATESEGFGAMRMGRWLIDSTRMNTTQLQAEEEEYTQRIIDYFNEGLVPLPDGVTLRAYLADKLSWYVPSCPTLPCLRYPVIDQS